MSFANDYSCTSPATSAGVDRDSWLGYAGSSSGSTGSEIGGQTYEDASQCVENVQYGSWVSQDAFTAEPTEVENVAYYLVGIPCSNDHPQYGCTEANMSFPRPIGDTLQFSSDQLLKTLHAGPQALPHAGYGMGTGPIPTSRFGIAAGLDLSHNAAQSDRAFDGVGLRGEPGAPWNQPGRQDLPTSSIAPSSYAGLHMHSSGNAWVVPQNVYGGNRCSHPSAGEPLPSMRVDVAACHALHPETLVRFLEDPLAPGFPDEHGPSRKGKKLTFRYAFVVGNEVLQNTSPKQEHEYASRHQSSKSVEAAWSRFGKPLRKDSESVPLVRATLVERAAMYLHQFMAELERQGTPLTFCGHKVDYNHLRIVRLIRPTPATIQPMLEILPEYRDFYLGSNSAM